MSATTIQWSEQRLEDFAGVRRYIFKHMNSLGKSHDAEDLAQNVFLTATQRMDTFDPAKGTFQGWLMGIAQNHIHRKARGAQVWETLVGAFQVDDEYGVEPTHEDISIAVTEKIFVAERMSKVLELVYQISDARYMVDRSLVLVRECDGDISKAARRLGLAPHALRYSHRKVQELVQLVDNSLNVHWSRRASGREGEPLSVRELLSCFPEPSEAENQWLRTIPVAVIRCGGWNVDQESLYSGVMELTGYSANTCRILVNRCRWYYHVARTIAEYGTLTDPAS